MAKTEDFAHFFLKKLETILWVLRLSNQVVRGLQSLFDSLETPDTPLGLTPTHPGAPEVRQRRLILMEYSDPPPISSKFTQNSVFPKLASVPS